MFVCLNLETTDLPQCLDLQRRKLRPRGSKCLWSICKSAPELVLEVVLEARSGGQALLGKLPPEYARAFLQPLWALPREGPNRSLCVSPQTPPFLMPVWITFQPVPSQALPEVWLPRLLVPGNPGALAVWRPRLGRSHSRQLSNSGCLGRGRPVYPGQSPGRGCSFHPMPLAHPAPQHTNSAVPGCICSFHEFLWRSYCVPSTLLHAEDLARQREARFPALMELTL